MTALAVLLLARLSDDLRTAEGRSFLWDRAIGLLCSVDTYLALLVILANALIYSLIIKGLYPARRATLGGLGKAVMLVKSDDLRPDAGGGEIGHFFIIFVLPFLLLKAGFAEYQWLKAWLFP